MSKYLDETGVEQVWDAVKNRSVPVKNVTREAYKALSDAEKDADVIWNVTDELPVDERITMDDIEQAIQDSGNDTPIGTIISFMGTSAPDEYLVCDGAVYNISNYSDLADFFLAQFGSKNYFGGNGTSTFAVPDLRNLFLRGYHGNASEQLSGEIGKKQDGTKHRSVIPGTSSGNASYIWANFNFDASSSTFDHVVNSDTESKLGGSHGYGYIIPTINDISDIVDSYTSRPINTAVLFCIKYTKPKTTLVVGGGDENVYSTGETVVGTWKDGKPIYRCNFSCTIDTSNEQTEIQIPELDPLIVDKITDQYGSVVGNWGGLCLPFGSNVFIIRYDSVFRINQYLSTSSNHILYIDAYLEYTKTTDEV